MTASVLYKTGQIKKLPSTHISVNTAVDKKSGKTKEWSFQNIHENDCSEVPFCGKSAVENFTKRLQNLSSLRSQSC